MSDDSEIDSPRKLDGEISDQTVKEGGASQAFSPPSSNQLISETSKDLINRNSPLLKLSSSVERKDDDTKISGNTALTEAQQYQREESKLSYITKTSQLSGELEREISMTGLSDASEAELYRTFFPSKRYGSTARPLHEIVVGARNNRYRKYGLPSSVWVRICSFLTPEQNRKLASVTWMDWIDMQRAIDGRFFRPPQCDADTPLPLWYDPNNLTILYPNWHKCPSIKRLALFKLFKDIRVLNIDSRCIGFPPILLYNLINQNAPTLRKLNIMDVSKDDPSKLLLPGTVPASKRIEHLSLPGDKIVRDLWGRESTKMKNLKEIIVEGSHALAWIPLLHSLHCDEVRILVLKLPSLVQSLVCGHGLTGVSAALIKKLPLLTRFLTRLSQLKKFSLDFAPVDTAGRRLAYACLRWIGTDKGSKHLKELEFGKTGAQELLQQLHSHFITLLSKEGGIPDLECSAAGYNISDSLETPRSSVCSRSLETHELPVKDLPKALLQPFSVVCLQDAKKHAEGMDSISLKHTMDQKMRTVMTYVDPIIRGSKSVAEIRRDRLSCLDDPLLLHLIQAERFKYKTRKALKTLRGSLVNLRTIRIPGVAGLWSEFVWLSREIGPQLKFVVDELHASIVDPCLGQVLPVVAPSLRRLRLSAIPITPLTDKKVNGHRHVRSESNSGIVMRRLASVTLDDSVMTSVNDLPFIWFPKLDFISISGLHPVNDEIVLEALKHFEFRPHQLQKSTSKEPISEPPPPTDIREKLRRLTASDSASEKEEAKEEKEDDEIEDKEDTVDKTTPSTSFELELIFNEMAVDGDNALISKKLISSIGEYLTVIRPTALSLAPIPHPSVLEEFVNCAKAVSVIIRPYFSTHRGLTWSHIKVPVIDWRISSGNARIQQISIESYENVLWLLRCGLQLDSSTRVFLRPRTITVEPSIESLVNVAFAFDNFTMAQTIGERTVDRLLQSTFHHFTFCSLVEEFSRSLELLQLKFLLPVDFAATPADELAEFFKAVEERFTTVLESKGFDNYAVTSELECRTLSLSQKAKFRQNRVETSTEPCDLKRLESKAEKFLRRLKSKKSMGKRQGRLEEDEEAERQKAEREKEEREAAEREREEEEKRALEEIAEIRKIAEEEAFSRFSKGLALIKKTRGSVSSASSKSNDRRSSTATVKLTGDSPDEQDLSKAPSATSKASESSSGRGSAPDPFAVHGKSITGIGEQTEEPEVTQTSQLPSLGEDELCGVVRQQSSSGLSAALSTYRSQAWSSMGEEEGVRYRYRIRDKLEDGIEYFEKQQRRRPIVPLIWDSNAAYLDSKVVSPPYPDGGVFTITITRTDRVALAKTLQMATRAIRFAVRMQMWGAEPYSKKVDRVMETGDTDSPVTKKLKQLGIIPT